ncbi:response regulator transcription factor [Candidatus Dojkabacteria bacterium]|uniref:Response regulator transcription factor n=1 Tax=Candidatus Dojkabacteria bacterium TaxID=2099670 RepID=A0A955RKP9_9BACT|nr:response regulator transcription factor [Candidatus Dojkabacteria bacterium]
MNILVVEDEKSIREVEAAYLKQQGYTVFEAQDGEEALEVFADKSIDLIILDLNLPSIDGIEVCRKIRNKSLVPIIMVTARIEEIDELVGLETGADDYIKKPFSPAILIARVKSALRRVDEGIVEEMDLHIDPEKMLVEKEGKKISFTTTQFNILYTLVKNPGKVFTREEILDRAYDDSLPPDVLDRTVDAHIKSIRKKLDDKQKYIHTVIGKGYKFGE